MKGQAKAQLNNLRMSPQKVRLLADLVRGLPAEDAVVQLQFSKKHAARPLKKLLESAIANAENNNNLKKDTLKVETIYVNEGSTLRRWMPRAMGRATPLRKRSSHITLVLEGDVDEAKVKAFEKENKVKKDENEKEDKKIEGSKDQKEDNKN